MKFTTAFGAKGGKVQVSQPAESWKVRQAAMGVAKTIESNYREAGDELNAERVRAIREYLLYAWISESMGGLRLEWVDREDGPVRFIAMMREEMPYAECMSVYFVDDPARLRPSSYDTAAGRTTTRSTAWPAASPRTFDEPVRRQPRRQQSEAARIADRMAKAARATIDNPDKS